MAHTDIWLYTRTTSRGEEQLCSKDVLGFYTCRSACHIYPLRYHYWHAFGMNVTLPAAPHAISRLEYGGTYMTPVLYRADCIHNFVNGRLWYG
jgi:hypothetical protein